MPNPFARFDLSNRVALVTGSSQGLGLAIAKGLGEAGARVILNGRDADKLEKAQREFEGQGIAAKIASFDVTERDAVVAAVAAVERDIGPIDILVNNAGIQRRAPLVDYPLETWREILKANLDSVFFVAQAVGAHMVRRQRGKIINICSVQSELGRPSIVPYTATKGAVKMMTKGMCAEWGKHNIQVNGIGPGYFKTPLNQALVDDPQFSAWLCARTPAGRWGDVEELMGAAIFLASDASNFVNGHILYVDGGMTAVV